jgi:hypothetical protein
MNLFMNETHIPNETDWEDYWSDLDTNYAHSRFAGKTIWEVLHYFDESPLVASEDISYMPAIPFRFYIQAYTRYLMSAELYKEDPSLMSDEEYRNCFIDSQLSDGASSFLGLMVNKLNESPHLILPSMKELMPVAEYVATNQVFFGATVDIYGSFPELLAQIRAAYERVLDEAPEL